MADPGYEAHLARHTATVNRVGSLAGDSLVLLSFAPLFARRTRLAATMFFSGFGVMLLCHAIAGNLREELTSLAKEPVRSSVYEARFLASLWQQAAGSQWR